MKQLRDHFLRSLVVLAIAAGAVTVMSATANAAFPLRSPQVVVNGGSLQAYFNSISESIDVQNDQLDAQTWSTSISGNSTLTLMLELAAYADQNALGVYNGSAGSPPTLFQVFPGAATPGWYATAHFGTDGSLVVSLFDQNSVYQGQNSYMGVDRNNFGFYIQNTGGTYYSQDYRNAGYAHVLTYAGTGINYGDWWECFEDLPNATSDFNFSDAVLLVQSVSPVPAGTSSWGSIKGLYR